jgi:hypothetical protein
MAKLIELFEENVFDRNCNTHGFEWVELISNYQYGDLEEKVTKIIKQDGSDALVLFQRGVKNGKIDLFEPPRTFGESVFVFSQNVPHRVFGMECMECLMGVFTEAQMEEYLEKYIEETIKQKVYGLLDEIQKVMEAKNIHEANIELYEDYFENCENASLEIKAISGEMVAKFSCDSEEENYSFTVTKCNGEQKLDGIVEAYEFFGYAFRNDKWEDFLEPLEIWLKQNNN